MSVLTMNMNGSVGKMSNDSSFLCSTTNGGGGGGGGVGGVSGGTSNFHPYSECVGRRVSDRRTSFSSMSSLESAGAGTVGSHGGSHGGGKLRTSFSRSSFSRRNSNSGRLSSTNRLSHSLTVPSLAMGPTQHKSMMMFGNHNGNNKKTYPKRNNSSRELLDSLKKNGSWGNGSWASLRKSAQSTPALNQNGLLLRAGQGTGAGGGAGAGSAYRPLRNGNNNNINNRQSSRNYEARASGNKNGNEEWSEIPCSVPSLKLPTIMSPPSVSQHSQHQQQQQQRQQQQQQQRSPSAMRTNLSRNVIAKNRNLLAKLMEQPGPVSVAEGGVSSVNGNGTSSMCSSSENTTPSSSGSMSIVGVPHTRSRSMMSNGITSQSVSASVHVGLGMLSYSSSIRPKSPEPREITPHHEITKSDNNIISTSYSASINPSGIDNGHQDESTLDDSQSTKLSSVHLNELQDKIEEEEGSSVTTAASSTSDPVDPDAEEVKEAESMWPQYPFPTLIDSCPTWLSSFLPKATESLSRTISNAKLSYLPIMSAHDPSLSSSTDSPVDASTNANGADTSTTSQHKRARAAAHQPPKKVCFSIMEDVISYEVHPEDIKASWPALNVPRTLKNIELISRHRGINVSYSAAAHIPGKTCMVHIEPSALIGELEETKGRHQRAVLEEQARQRREGDGMMDEEKLAEVAGAYSRWGVELAMNSWWLER